MGQLARVVLTLATAAVLAPAQNEMIRWIRNKISAGDLASAESLLEQHQAEKGADTEYVVGISWLARGAALLGDWPAAERYSAQTRPTRWLPPLRFRRRCWRRGARTARRPSSSMKS